MQDITALAARQSSAKRWEDHKDKMQLDERMNCFFKTDTTRFQEPPPDFSGQGHPNFRARINA
jgi:hypothetical protein